MTSPVPVSLLTFEGCPNRRRAADLVVDLAAEMGLAITLDVVDVASPRDAERLRFLGSPTVRVNGRDVEPGADDRAEFALSCRVYATTAGPSGLPPADWVRAALAAARSDR